MRSALVHASQTSSRPARYVWLMVTVRASPASSTRVPTRRRTALICWVTSIMSLSPLGLGCALRYWAGEAALAPAPGQFGGQRLQVRGPESPEAIEPRVEFPQRFGVHRVQPPGPLRPHRRQPAVPEHLEMLGYGRLGDPELVLDDRADRTGGQLALGEQFEDPPAYRVAEYVERVHAPQNIKGYLYKSIFIVAPAGYGLP